MSELNNTQAEKKKIIRASILSVIIGGFLLVGALLPAEFGIDPLGIGKFMGFNKLYAAKGEVMPKPENLIKQEKSTYPLIYMNEAGCNPEVLPPSEGSFLVASKSYIDRKDELEIVIPAGKGLEYKINMNKYGKVKYEWVANQSDLFFDFHGEYNEKEHHANVFYESYTVAYSNNMVGTFTAPFDGRHGWYFKNISDKDVKVTLKLKGSYELIEA
ncbi:MAG: hypothetical protein ACEPOW_04910 [Bacteroidales bacterium]